MLPVAETSSLLEILNYLVFKRYNLIRAISKQGLKLLFVTEGQSILTIIVKIDCPFIYRLSMLNIIYLTLNVIK